MLLDKVLNPSYHESTTLNQNRLNRKHLIHFMRAVAVNPTIKDVAKLAGVSAKTVSNVINDNADRFSPETRARVLDAVKKLNYRPNRAAQYMRSGTIGVLAFALPNIGSPYHAELAREIIDAAQEQGHTILIEHTGGLIENERLLLGGSSRHTVDGVILDPLALTESELYQTAVTTPIVTVGERATGQHYDHIMIDNVAAARLIVEHLVEVGRRRIAIFPVVPDVAASLFNMRYQGYVDALQAGGIGLDPRLVMTAGVRSRDEMDFRGGMICMERLLSQGKPPDGVFCLNDRVALGAMKVLREHGLRVPDDIAVAGFDDIAESNLTCPALTTISPDKHAIGRLAVSLLIDRIKGVRTGPPELFNPEFTLVVRESTVGR